MDAGILASKFCELGMNINKMCDRRDRARPVFSEICVEQDHQVLKSYQLPNSRKMVNAGILASTFSRKIFPQIIIVGYTNL